MVRKISFGVAVSQVVADKRRAAAATCLGSVASDAGLTVQLAIRRNRLCVSAEGILLRFWPIALG